MTTFNKFEEMIVWRKSRIILVKIMRLFEGHHDYSFINQLKRAALSIVNNIAE
jgi:four helix bundle protein